MSIRKGALGYCGLLLSLASISIITGCAVLDSTLMDTAETLPPGEIRTVTYGVYGINPNTLICTPEIDHEQYNSTEIKQRFMTGHKFEYGLAKNVELGCSFQSLFGAMNMGVKLKLIDSGKTKLAIMPGAFYMKNKGPNNSEDTGETELYGEQYATGIDVPMLLTVMQNDKVSYNYGAKLGYMMLEYFRSEQSGASQRTVSRGELNTPFVTLSLGMMIKFRRMHISPEIGITRIQTSAGEYQSVPLMNLGFGFDLPNKGGQK